MIKSLKKRLKIIDYKNKMNLTNFNKKNLKIKIKIIKMITH